MTHMIELPIARPIEMTSGGRQRRNVIAGEFMVTPVKPLELDDGDGPETLHPGRTHLSPSHWAVRERPEWFRPCMKGDKPTAAKASRRGPMPVAEIGDAPLI